MNVRHDVQCGWVDRKQVDGKAVDTQCDHLGAKEVLTPLVMGSLAKVMLCVKHNAIFNDLNANLRLGRRAR